MTKLNMNEARERLPELLDEGARGEEIVITAGDGATYKIIVLTLERSRPARRFAGLGKGNIAFISTDFDAELPDAFWLGET